jgi:predicted histidine transporter YuiF (NhaC family)
MNDQLKWGIGTLILGGVGFVLLGITGAFQNPFGPDMQNRPVNLIAIGGSLLLVVSGVATVVQSRRPD